MINSPAAISHRASVLSPSRRPTIGIAESSLIVEEVMTVTVSAGAGVLERMDEAKLSRLHWQIMFISGMGFFTDAYDLFIIGVVMALLKEEWKISPTEEGLVASTALLASAVGAVLFGRVADMLGRKRIYGYEVLVLAIGAVASALSPDIWWLCFPHRP